MTDSPPESPAEVQVTKTYLPDFDEFVARLREMWERGQITNHGPEVTELEERLRQTLGVEHLVLVANGTLALQIAIKALELRGEVATTPFSYVATASSLVWEGCRPRFVDVDPDTLCLDPALADQACAAGATAIVATHVYGNACDVEALAAVATRHRVPLVYDAAHAFGARLDGHALAAFGDASILSFHATKLFHTVEGGALVTADAELAHRLRYLRNFGHRGQEAFWGLGINAKMGELHAAMGLALLPHLPEIVRRRALLSALYDELVPANLARPRWHPGLERNWAYYPVLFADEPSLLVAKKRLESHGVFPRRYFYPALSTLPFLAPSPCPVAESAASRVLCLPMGHDVTEDVARRIAALLD